MVAPVNMQRVHELADASTGKLEIFLDPTVPAPTTPGATVQDVRCGLPVPPALQKRYQHIERIGEGGMGVVYRAHDPRLERDVALKLLKESDFASRSRFLDEARAQARVEHDDICRVYEVGEVDDEPFIIMQLIDGKPLSCVKQFMTLRERIELMRTVAFAVHAAHERGLVHRDLKPGNILVEKRANGAYRPYVVDFGLAWQFTQEADQLAHASLGTPAYMAPEAASKHQGTTIDARMDVYSLGATLFDVLAGRPPYIDDAPWNILHRLQHESPPPIGEVSKEVTAGLQAIVMKCLERDPNRRYPSAQALGDDLQRYLKGEPLEAQSARAAHRFRKIMRKHARKMLVVLGLTMLLAAGTGVRVREQRAATKMPVDLAQEIGQSVAEMELYMRTAYQLPAHDIGRERAVVRERIHTLERRIADAGVEDNASAQYAIGRAYFAMGDDVRAYEHLKRAEQAGYSSPELTYALSMAQLGTFRFYNHEASLRATDPRVLKAEVDNLLAQYFDPALERLRTAEPARIKHPAYAAAFVAYRLGRHDEAAQKAREAFQQAPLLYEAKLLEGAALVEVASKHWSSGKPDWFDKMSAGMSVAFERFAVAENIARSDPRVHLAICTARTRLMYAAFSAEEKNSPTYYEAAKESCDRLVMVDPASVEGHLHRAHLYGLHAYAISKLERPDTDPLNSIEEAIRVGKEAKQFSSGGQLAYDALGLALRARASVLLHRGLDEATTALEVAARHHAEGRGIFRYNEALRDGHMFMQYVQGIDEARRGIDIARRVDTVNTLVDEAVAVNQSVGMAYSKRAMTYLARAEQLLERGESPQSAVEGTLEAFAAGAKINPMFASHDLRARAHLVLARHAILTGVSPRNALDQATNELNALRDYNSTDVSIDEIAGRIALTEAEERRRSGTEPREFLEKARKSFQRAITNMPWSLEPALCMARLELLTSQIAFSKRRATPVQFEAIRAPLQSWLKNKLAHPEPYALMAASHVLAAEWRSQRRQTPDDDVRAGLAMMEQALAVNPTHPLALEMQNRLRRIRDKANK